MAVRAVRGAVVVRLLAHVETELPTSRIAHVHLGAAAALRKDIAQ